MCSQPLLTAPPGPGVKQPHCCVVKVQNQMSTMEAFHQQVLYLLQTSFVQGSAKCGFLLGLPRSSPSLLHPHGAFSQSVLGGQQQGRPSTNPETVNRILTICVPPEGPSTWPFARQKPGSPRPLEQLEPVIAIHGPLECHSSWKNPPEAYQKPSLEKIFVVVSQTCMPVAKLL